MFTETIPGLKLDKKSYHKKEWFEFSEKVQKRDNYTCLKCHKHKGEAILQTHHTKYYPNKKAWEYILSDCITLCKGCHALTHNKIEPTFGWDLISIEDLEERIGICEKEDCGKDIQFEHLIYHPNYGYKIVGSTCVEYLTREDQFLSAEILKIFKQISQFVNKSCWNTDYTKKGLEFIYTKYKHDIIRIYGDENVYEYQIAIKVPGVNYHDYTKKYKIINKNIDKAKELAFIALKGLRSEKEHEKEILRNIYRNIK